MSGVGGGGGVGGGYVGNFFCEFGVDGWKWGYCLDCDVSFLFVVCVGVKMEGKVWILEFLMMDDKVEFFFW